MEEMNNGLINENPEIQRIQQKKPFLIQTISFSLTFIVIFKVAYYFISLIKQINFRSCSITQYFNLQASL